MPLKANEEAELLKLLEAEDREKKALAIDCSNLSREQANEVYNEVQNTCNTLAQRHLCKSDLFYLLSRACKRKDIDHDWLYDRCREVQASPNGHLDLWSREHYKSTIITFGLSIQRILQNPEVLIGIFSHTRPNAKGFLDQIKRELEQNQTLKDLFPDILYQNPQAESPKWSLDSGIIVKRQTNPKEATVEAWGVVDGQPTGKHFTDLVYDDIVTRESVTTPEQIQKTTDALVLSYNLGARGGVKRAIGTRYHANDSYKTIIERGTFKPRIKAATHDGTIDGEPVFLTKEQLFEKRRDMGPYIFSSQMLQNPTADKLQGFQVEWLKFYEKIDYTKWNKYIVVDPASEKKKTSDYTVFWVIGLAPDNNYYVIDCVRDRLNLTQKAKVLFELHRKYQPNDVGYEKYGMQSDIEHFYYLMEQQNYRFSICELGGAVAKVDRIKALVPVFEQSRMWFPKKLNYLNHENRMVDLVEEFINEEYQSFPVSTHDDMLDCLARILDANFSATFPKIKKQPEPEYVYPPSGSDTGWMG